MRHLAALSIALLAALPTAAAAQGLLDRLGAAVAPPSVVHDTSPQALAERGVFVYDHRSDLANMAFDALPETGHMFVATTLTGETKPGVVFSTGPDCVGAAVSYARVHGGGFVYCHPLALPPGTPAP